LAARSLTTCWSCEGTFLLGIAAAAVFSVTNSRLLTLGYI
jgi:hypothetical protein